MRGLTGFVGTIPSGIAGTRATLATMTQMIRRFLRPRPNDPEGAEALMLVRSTAQQAVQNIPEKAYFYECACLHEFCRDRVRYVQDMLEMETLQMPDKTLMLGSGDCDDKALLFCAMASCIGYPARFCAVSIDGDGGYYSHVSGQALVPGHGWINAECIPVDDDGTKVEFGWFPPDVQSVMFRHI